MNNELDHAKAEAAATSISGAGRETAISDAVNALARVQELLKADPAYAESLGISKRGMDFVCGAEATLRATGAGAQGA